MKRLIKHSLWLLPLLVLAALMAAAALALQRQPTVGQPAALSPADIGRAKEFLRRNDPRRAVAGALRVASLNEAELALLLRSLAGRYPLALRVELEQQQAWLDGSLALRPGWWLNVRARLRETESWPRIEALSLGRLPLPDWLAQRLGAALLQRLMVNEEARLAHDLLRQVQLRPDRLLLLYQWQADSYERVVASLMPAPEQERLRIYAQRLSELAADYPRGSRVSLVRLLPPLFALAAERSRGDAAAAAAENRAALLTLAVYASGLGLPSLLPAASQWPQPQPLEIQLQGRPDFPQHLLVSAVIAAEGGGPLADAVGVYKEVADTRGGSGFSFNDIGADRAGTRLGVLAIEQALRLQQRLAAGLSEPELLPDLSDLPEYLSAAEFRRRYERTGSPAYQAVMESIEARLDKAPLLPPP